MEMNKDELFKYIAEQENFNVNEYKFALKESMAK